MQARETDHPQNLELHALAADCLNYLKYLSGLGVPNLPEEFSKPNRAAPQTSTAASQDQPAKPAGELLSASAPDAASGPCHACPQQETFRDLFQPPAELMLIVESSSKPSLLSGEEGRLMVNIIEKGYRLPLDRVCLAPARKCRRGSTFCQALWQAYQEKARPRAIMIMGARAGEAALGPPEESNPWRRGLWRNWRQVPALLTHSPASLLENPELKRETWADIKKVLAYLASLPPVKGDSA